MSGTESPIECRLDALKPEQRSRRAELARKLSAAAAEIQEIAAGYKVSLPATEDMWVEAAEFISLERRCCPFLKFSLEAGAEDGPIQIFILGRAGVKAFIAAELFPSR